MLAYRFGNEYVISFSIIDTLKNGRPVCSAIELQQLADDLSFVIEILQEPNMSSEIDNQFCIIDIVQHCTTSVQHIWCKVALDQKQRFGTCPKFSDFVTFMCRIAVESIIPIYGDEAMKVKRSPMKCDVEKSCEQNGTCVDDSGVGDKVTDVTKSDIQDSCQHGTLVLTIQLLMTR